MNYMNKDFLVLYLIGLETKGYQVGDLISKTKYGNDFVNLINRAPDYLMGRQINLQSLWEVVVYELYEARNKGPI